MDEPHDDHVTPAAESAAEDAEDAAPAPRQESQRGPRPPSRRWFVAGAAALVVGGGAGVAFDFARGRPTRPARPPLPGAVRSALAEERTLLAHARDARRRSGHDVPADVLDALVRDHEAHLTALIAATAGFTTPKHAPDSAAPSGAGDRAVLRRLEDQASQHAAQRARQLSGNAAALLASIAACEATHVELLT